MAMVTAARGSSVIKVSRNAYETIFRKKGYKEISETKHELEYDDLLTHVEEETTEVEETEEEIETIPISEMNKEQLAEYAKEHNIDTSSARNVREARQIIQKAIREQKM